MRRLAIRELGQQEVHPDRHPVLAAGNQSRRRWRGHDARCAGALTGLPVAPPADHPSVRFDVDLMSSLSSVPGKSA